ncbi:carbonic anhydrase 15-like [Agrilus planipennis]|uniref:Carbonic anhydrase 15-like n=1 Tax=Agrilus planipennis TaxID=224129 RepID=A0A1W4X6R8_AGRPL|nr:carbonic anhydrase 15-like [Agrilus planipennis]
MKMSSLYMQNVFIILLTGISVSSTSHDHWGYSREEQAKWKDNYKSCGGDSQSPVAIYSSKSIPMNMSALELIHYRDPLPGPLKLHNNGHTVVLTIGPESRHRRVPYIFGGMLADEYVFESLHFHWGDVNSLGSEHEFNDVKFTMEMHLVHRNKKFQNIEEASHDPKGLAVLAFFFQLREKENKPLNHIVRHLPRVYESDASFVLNETLTLASILPSFRKMGRFYMYPGSLTTPPCSEAVMWVVFSNPMPVSDEQVIKNFLLSRQEVERSEFRKK